MRRVICVIALGLTLGACETYGPDYDGGYGYAGYGDGRFVREQQCYEVRQYFTRPYVECRYVKRWKQNQYTQYNNQYSKPRWRDREREDDDYSYREPKRRWRDKEYYD